MGMTATMAMFTGLCGFRRKRQPALSAPVSDENSDTQTEEEKPEQTTFITTSTTAFETEQVTVKELPLPPGLRKSRSSNIFTIKSESERKLCTTLTVKHIKSISVKLRDRKKRSKDDDTIWKKTIILGGKCKISDDVDDAIIFTGKRDTVLAYHPRTLSTISVSRTGLKNKIGQFLEGIPSKNKTVPRKG
ncbi:hypothetical protein F3Y22_tig00110201pilonHSYRG00084 [Hibiscus syriacus]|uniref:Uncharacterized protein n=1 Tax=Hibiscus syriacus TaxID=106335 RepID=A0A6A3BAF3_HIBSY|nr:hypothetical protein F3Y22_tig00110201pilonHSYRG00084 [Hibiscus syriacus]